MIKTKINATKSLSPLSRKQYPDRERPHLTLIDGVKCYKPWQRSHLKCLESIRVFFIGHHVISNIVTNLSRLCANLLGCNFEDFLL